jgi:hypothetical protein
MEGGIVQKHSVKDSAILPQGAHHVERLSTVLGRLVRALVARAYANREVVYVLENGMATST